MGIRHLEQEMFKLNMLCTNACLSSTMNSNTSTNMGISPKQTNNLIPD